MDPETERILASGRGERAAPGWAAVMLVATLAVLESVDAEIFSNPHIPLPNP